MCIPNKNLQYKFLAVQLAGLVCPIKYKKVAKGLLKRILCVTCHDKVSSKLRATFEIQITNRKKNIKKNNNNNNYIDNDNNNDNDNIGVFQFANSAIQFQ